MAINFYKTLEPYGEFSNFSRHPIVLKGKAWPTTEHYFQAQKFSDTEHEEAVRCCSGPMNAAKMGRRRDLPLRKDWEDVKERIMMEALVAKVRQHPSVKKLLLETGDETLVEHTVNDSYWGDGGDGSGKNRLGYLLMELRKQLRESENNTPLVLDDTPAYGSFT